MPPACSALGQLLLTQQAAKGKRTVWRAQDAPAVSAHQKFIAAMKAVGMNIARRNGNKADKIRADKAIPYTYLIPHAPEGITSSGVAQSVSY